MTAPRHEIPTPMPSQQITLQSGLTLSRRNALATTAGMCGLSLPGFLQLQASAAPSTGTSADKAKACIIIYCWGGMSHLESFDLKPDAPSEIRGEFSPIPTVVPGIEIGEHLPLLARHTDKLAIVRSINHDDSSHGRGMYWNLTGHRPPRAGNIPPMREDWPSLPAMISKFRSAPRGVPTAVRLPYPMVDNNTLQAGEYGGWLGVKYDPIVMRPASGEPFGGVSRTLGSEVLDLSEVNAERLASRRQLLAAFEAPTQRAIGYEGFQHFHGLAEEILAGSAVKNAYNLDRETPQVRESYGKHLGGQSLLLARRLTEAGVPVVQVCCSAGDLNGGSGDMWDTHGDNFNRLKKNLLPVLDRATSALLQDLSDRGTLDETLVVLLTDFGRTPHINGAAGRDHYPSVYSVALAGGGIQGGQVYGSSDRKGAFPKTQPCTPPDIHATIFHALGISPRAELHDMLNRPFPVSDGEVLPLS
ncbi:MAG: DUF1501 domain-containing protein [Planctomycetota bacterium]|nr:MAG: DUF1501 domain-containing protein [Planctomycetota bacterium]